MQEAAIDLRLFRLTLASHTQRTPENEMYKHDFERLRQGV